jgi:AmiR/NasT family two-component response regulator
MTQSISEPPTLAGRRIVVCEDEGITQLQLQRMLKRAGLEVVGSAMNGQQAVDTILRERPDIVLMDISMPVMDGLDAAAYVVKEYRPCLILLTANDGEEYRKRAAEIGVDGYIIKPVVSDTLLPALLEVWRSFRSRAA